MMNLLLFTNFDPADIPTNTKMRRIIVYGSVTRYGPQSVAQRGHSVVGPIVDENYDITLFISRGRI